MPNRQSAILRFMRYGDEYAAVDLLTMFGRDAPAPATVRRDMQALVLAGCVEQSGERRGTVYRKTLHGALETPYDPAEYYAQSELVRRALEQYQYGYLDLMEDYVISQETIVALDTATKRYHERSIAASLGVRKRELERFVIEFSWKSSAIEGNTYTLLDTERLLAEGIEAHSHSKEEARMILNHKQALSFAVNLAPEVAITRRLVEDLHVMLTEGLGVSHGVRRGEVGIVGTSYRPPFVSTKIEEELDRLCERVQSMADPYSRALLALVGISYLQPFEDGNKRTARLFANALLLQCDIAPLSYRDTDVRTYRESMLVFYEQLSVVPMRNIFVDQYRYACEHYLVGA